MSKILAQLFQAADQHGEDEAPDHTVGDLQALLRRTWLTLNVAQKQELLNSPEVADLVDTGSRGEFEVTDLCNELDREIEDMHVAIRDAGYTLYQDDEDDLAHRYYWETAAEIRSELFADREEAINDAFRNLHAHSL